MNYTNRNNIPDEFVNAIIKRGSQYTKGDADYSVSDLLRAPREVILNRRHADEISIDVSDLLSSWEGNLIHDAIEDDVGRTFQYFTINDRQVRLSGKADFLCTTSDGRRILKDYKTTSVWSYIYKSSFSKWSEQLNCYALLYGLITEASIVVYMTDWQKSRARNERDYPQTKIAEVKFPLWSYDETEAFITSKLQMLEDNKAVEDNLLPLCTDEEMWAEPTRWALYKNDNKRATKIFDAHEDAVTAASLTKGGHIRRREGRRRKCEEYCQASSFCNQFQEWKAKVDNDGTEED